MRDMNTVKLHLPAVMPGFLPTEDSDAFIDWKEATVAQWRYALRLDLAERVVAVRHVGICGIDDAADYQRIMKDRIRAERQVLRIACAIGAAEHTPLWPQIEARASSNVVNLPARQPLSP
jgi:hypothetical protein